MTRGLSRALLKTLWGGYIAAGQLPFLLSRLIAWILRFSGSIDTSSGARNLMFVVPPSSVGWILEGICRDTILQMSRPAELVKVLWPLPVAATYFFPHYHILRNALALNPRVWQAQRVVYLTHKKEDESWKDVISVLKHATHVISMNSANAHELIEHGLPADRIHVCPGFADPARFLPHVRSGQGAIGLSSAYYPRKGADRLLDLALRLPHRRFLLLGRNWSQYPHFDRLQNLQNFEYVETSHRLYPEFYARMDVFLSLSRLEGGPIPLIEAMMCNLVPVATRTGFSPDVIRSGENGYLFDADVSSADIAELVEKAYRLDGNIRASVVHLSWRRFAEQLESLLPARLP